MPRFAVILPAAGRSSRFKEKEKKPFATLDGRAVWVRSAELFVTRDDVVQCLIVIHPDDDELFHQVLVKYQAPGFDHRRLVEWIARVDRRPRA